MEKKTWYAESLLRTIFSTWSLDGILIIFLAEVDSDILQEWHALLINLY